MLRKLKRHASFTAIAIAMTMGASLIPGAAQAQTRAAEKPTQADLLNRAQFEKLQQRLKELNAVSGQRATLPSDVHIREHIPGGSTPPVAPPFGTERQYRQTPPQLPKSAQSTDLKPIIAGVISEAEKYMARARPGKPVYLLFSENDHESITQKLVVQAVTKYFKDQGDRRGFNVLYAYEQPHNELQSFVQMQADRFKPGKKLSDQWTQQADPDGSETLKLFLSYIQLAEGAFSHLNLFSFMHENGIRSKGVDTARDGAIVDFNDPETRKMGLQYFKGQLPLQLSLSAREGVFFRNYMIADQLQREAIRAQASLVTMNTGNAHATDLQNDDNKRWLSIQGHLRAQGTSVLVASFDTNGSFVIQQMIENKKDHLALPVPAVSFKNDVAAEIQATKKFCEDLPALKYCFNKNALDKPYLQHVNARIPQWIDRPDMTFNFRPD